MCAKKISNSPTITDSIVKDRMSNLFYDELSRQEEIDFIKKTKLSYYNKVDDLKKAEYLEYYMEFNPEFRDKFYQANEEERLRLLNDAIKESLDYRNEFLSRNFRLVYKIANYYSFLSEFENLFQEGVLGMMRALEKFDLSKNVRFSTYATIWIRQFIIGYLDDRNSLIRVPDYLRAQVIKLEKLQNESQITDTEIQKMEAAEKLNISLEELDNLLVIQQLLHPTSLNIRVNADDNSSPLEDLIASDDPDFTEIVENSIIRKFLLELIDKADIPRREKKILCMRYGFYDNRVYTLEEIAKEFDVTRQRIKQIENKILKKLRTNSDFIALYESITNDSLSHDDFENSYSLIFKK